MLFPSRSKVKAPPIYEFPHQIKVLIYDGTTDERINESNVITIKYCKIEQATKSVTENYEQTLLSGSNIFIPFEYNTNIDDKTIKVFSKIQLPNKEEATIKTIDVTSIKGHNYAYEIFVA